jgi:hypothetical protein
MAASYPSSVKTFSTKTTGDTIEVADVNDPQAEITAVEGGLINGIAHHLIPDADGTRNLGSAAKQWAALYVDDLLAINGVSYVPPSADGSASQFLKTDGRGRLSRHSRRSICRRRRN